MTISDAEVVAMGFQLGGMVRPDPTPLHFIGRRGVGLFRVEVPCDAAGWITYIHRLNGEFKKAGKTGIDETFEQRMNGSYDCLRKPIDLINKGALVWIGESLYEPAGAAGQLPEPYRQDFPWKHRVPVAMLARETVELWFKKNETEEEMLKLEDALNVHYRGEWAKEGWTGQRGARRRWCKHRAGADGAGESRAPLLSAGVGRTRKRTT